MNQGEPPVAMPLERFREEAMPLLEKDGGAGQIPVERVRRQRRAAAESRQQDVPDVLAGRYRS